MKELRNSGGKQTAGVFYSLLPATHLIKTNRFRIQLKKVIP